MYALTLDVLGFEMSHVLDEQRTYCEMAVVHTFCASMQKRVFITARAVIIIIIIIIFFIYNPTELDSHTQ